MKYAHWGVICKTKDCGAKLFQKGSYIGPCKESDKSIKVAFEPPESVELLCPNSCGKTHTYTRQDWRVIQMDHIVEPDVEYPT